MSPGQTPFDWLRGVDLNHRPLGYEQNLMDLRGAKSNVMSSIGTYRNRNCPRVALLGRMAICVVWSSRRSLAN
jgi:hypothetical protein